MITFGADLIDRYNRQYEKGKFLKAVILTETYSPLVKKYFVDHEEPITYQGNVYNPLSMHWGRITTTSTMIAQGAEVALSNIGNNVVKYIKDIPGDPTSGDISGNHVTIQMLHLDLLATLTNPWRRLLKVLAVRADVNVAVFTLGRELGRNRLPRRLILPEEQG